ncbi:UNVERIFIED_CONTAM: hypothetical protein FKN15_044499 [Acipenser sinensis]
MHLIPWMGSLNHEYFMKSVFEVNPVFVSNIPKALWQRWNRDEDAVQFSLTA